MDFPQNQRLNENIEILEKSGFIKRNHVEILSVIVALYTAAFIGASFVAFVYEHDPVADIIAFLSLFGLATMINAIYLKNVNDKMNATEFQNLIFTSALKADCDYCLIFNYKGEVVYSPSTYSKDFNVNSDSDVITFDDIMQSLQLLPEQISKLADVVEDERNIFDDVNEPSNKQVRFKSFSLDTKNHNIVATKYLRPLGFSCLKINLINKEKILSKVLDNFNIGYYELDTSGFIININEYLSRNLGFSRNELVNSYKSLNEFIDASQKNESMYSKEHIQESWQGFLKLQNKYDENLSTFIIQKPIYSAKGVLEKISGFIIKLDDESLMIKSQGVEKGWIDYSWKSFFANSPYPIAITDKSGQILKINESCSDMVGDNIVGGNFADIFDKASCLKVIKEFESILNKNKKTKTFKSLKTKKSDKIFEVYMGKIMDIEDNPYGFIIRMSDITKQTQLQDSLSHSQRIQTMGQLVGSVAHDFNNILTAISGFCDLLLLKHKASDPSFTDIMQIKQNSDRATNLVKRLLAFSRKQTLKPNALNLTDLFIDFNVLIKRLIGSEIKYKIHIDDKLWDILVDPVQIEQVLLNLVVNARQAMDEKGTLAIYIDNHHIGNDQIGELKQAFNPSGADMPAHGDYVRVSIKDDGCGIPKKNLTRIFEPFFTTKAEKSGTGLGLATVYGIIKQSEGHVFVKSVQDKGTEFIILFKKLDKSKDELIENPITLEVDEIDEPHAKDTTGAETIVLVEDEDSVRMLAKNIFESKGYNVMDYRSAKLAFEKKEEFIELTDIIVTDVIMPEMTGPAFIKEIHKIKPHLKVLFMSGYGEDAFNEEYGSSRNFNFIAKPFGLRDLVSKVKEILD